jgi:hypothetical protein
VLHSSAADGIEVGLRENPHHDAPLHDGQRTHVRPAHQLRRPRQALVRVHRGHVHAHDIPRPQQAPPWAGLQRGTRACDPLRQAEKVGPLLAGPVLGVERGPRLRELRVLGRRQRGHTGEQTPHLLPHVIQAEGNVARDQVPERRAPRPGPGREGGELSGQCRVVGDDAGQSVRIRRNVDRAQQHGPEDLLFLLVVPGHEPAEKMRGGREEPERKRRPGGPTHGVEAAEHSLDHVVILLDPGAGRHGLRACTRRAVLVDRVARATFRVLRARTHEPSQACEPPARQDPPRRERVAHDASP